MLSLIDKDVLDLDNKIYINQWRKILVAAIDQHDQDQLMTVKELDQKKMILIWMVIDLCPHETWRMGNAQ